LGAKTTAATKSDNGPTDRTKAKIGFIFSILEPPIELANPLSMG